MGEVRTQVITTPRKWTHARSMAFALTNLPFTFLWTSSQTTKCSHFFTRVSSYKSDLHTCAYRKNTLNTTPSVDDVSQRREFVTISREFPKQKCWVQRRLERHTWTTEKFLEKSHWNHTASTSNPPSSWTWNPRNEATTLVTNNTVKSTHSKHYYVTSSIMSLF